MQKHTSARNIVKWRYIVKYSQIYIRFNDRYDLSFYDTNDFNSPLTHMSMNKNLSAKTT